MPATFSRKTNPGRTTSIARSICGQRCLSSSVPFRNPAVLNGWHGNPAVSQSKQPENRSAGKVVTSGYRASIASLPSSAFATRFAAAKASISTATTRNGRPNARCNPSSSPAYPAQNDKTVMSLVLPTFPNFLSKQICPSHRRYDEACSIPGSIRSRCNAGCSGMPPGLRSRCP